MKWEISVTTKGESSLNEGKGRSVFVVTFDTEGDLKGQLFEVKLDRGGKVLGGWEDGWEETSTPLEPVARFFDQTVPPFLNLNGVWIRDKLHMFLNCYSLPEDIPEELQETPEDIPEQLQDTPMNFHSLSGHIFNMETKELVDFGHPIADKSPATVFCAYEKIYFLLEPSFFSSLCFPVDIQHTFERYDPYTDSWQPLMPFPYSKDWIETEIIGYAICGDSILFSITGSPGCERSPAVMAYHLDRNIWESIKIEDGAQLCWSGRAVVVGSTVFALSWMKPKVITFSVRMGAQIDDGLGKTASFSLSKPSELPGLEVKFPCGKGLTQYLTHLGQLEFCLVQSGFNLRGNRCLQPICVTTFRIKEGKIKVLDSTRRFVDNGGADFQVGFCFPMEQEVTCQRGGWWAMNKELVFRLVPLLIVAGMNFSKLFKRD